MLVGAVPVLAIILLAAGAHITREEFMALTARVDAIEKKARENAGQLVLLRGKVKRLQEEGALLQHRFNHSVRGRHQIRAIVERARTSEALKDLAVRLAEENPEPRPHYLVQFFDDPRCLTGWNGSGGVKPSQEAHYLGQVVVDPDETGRLYARKFTPSPYPMAGD